VQRLAVSGPVVLAEEDPEQRALRGKFHVLFSLITF
jgi:hypothetical protein